MGQPFVPTLKWHLKVLAIVLLLCAVMFCIFSWVSHRLPPPYQRKTPSLEVTPWVHAEVNK